MGLFAVLESPSKPLINKIKSSAADESDGIDSDRTADIEVHVSSQSVIHFLSIPLWARVRGCRAFCANKQSEDLDLSD
jgi:hypothetical protein